MLLAVYCDVKAVPAGEIPNCDHSNESSSAILMTLAVAVRGSSDFETVDEIKCEHSSKPIEHYFRVVLPCCLPVYKVATPFESVDEILRFDHSSERYRAVLSYGVVNIALQGGSNS